MTLSSFDLAAIGVYVCAMVVLAYFTRRTKTFSDFAIAKHSIPTVLIFASLATTIVGPGFSVGFTSRAWGSGYLFYFLALGYALQVVIVGLLVAPRLAEHRDCNSLGDVMRKKYGVIAQLLTGIVSVGLCIGFTAVMGRVGGGILHAVTGWPLLICLSAVTGVTALLTFSGGLRATVATEGMQFALKCSAVALLVLVLAMAANADIGATAQRARQLTESAWSGLSGWQVAGIVLSFTVGEALIPPYANRALAAKSQSSSTAGFVLAGVFCILWLGMVAYLGVAAHTVVAPDTSADDVFITAGRTLLPVGLFGVLLTAIVAIVMSSQESVLNSSAVAFVRDIVTPLRKPSDGLALGLAKASTLLFAAASVYAAQFAPNIIDGLLILYSIWAPTILVALIAGLFLEKTRPLAGLLSIIAGGLAAVSWQTILAEPGQVPAIIVGLVASAIGYGLGHVLGRPIAGIGVAP